MSWPGIHVPEMAEVRLVKPRIAVERALENFMVRVLRWDFGYVVCSRV